MIKKTVISILLLIMMTISVTGCGSDTTDTGVTEGVSSESTVSSSMTVSEDTEQVIPEEPDLGPEKTTLMIYMIGSDLESGSGAATEDIKEMEASKVNTDKVNILLYTGGSAAWYSDIDISSDDNTLFILKENGFEKITSSPEMSMGNPENLAGFLKYAYENYPADSFSLILWDHGNGPVMGYGLDKLHSNDSLTLPELREALEASPFGTDNRLFFIGFDACLMASAELAITVSDYATYLIASQETEPSFGWNYDFLPMLHRAGQESLPGKIIDYYMEYCQEFNETHPMFSSDITLSAVDLSLAGELKDAIENLFRAAASDVSGNFKNLAMDRISSRDLGRASTGSDYDLVDLLDLANNMSGHFPREAGVLKDVMSKMVIYNDANTFKCSGMSIYYPFYNKSYYDYQWKEAYSELGIFNDYIEYLSQYEVMWLADASDSYTSTVLSPLQISEDTYTLQLTEDQTEAFARARYYIFQREGDTLYRPIYIGSGVTEQGGKLTAKFDGNVVYWKDNFGRKDIAFLSQKDSIDGVSHYSVNGMVLNGDLFNRDSNLVEILLEANEASHEIEIMSVYDNEKKEDETIGTGKRTIVDLGNWDRMMQMKARARHITRDKNGVIKPFAEWDSDSTIYYSELSLHDGFTYTYEPLYEDGYDYFICFDIMDVSGNRFCSELLPVPVSKMKEEEKKDPIDISFDSGSEKVFLDKDGIKVSAVLGRDCETGSAILKFKAENSNEHGYYVSIHGVDVDGNFALANDLTILAGAGSFGVDTSMEIGSACKYEGVKYPKEISFEIDVSDEVTGKTLCYCDNYHITVSDKLSPELVLLPVGGVTAKQQVIEDNDSYKITLLGTGALLREYVTETEAFSSILEIENKTGKLLSISPNLLINGKESRGTAMYNSVEVSAGSKIYAIVDHNIPADAVPSDGNQPFKVSSLEYVFDVYDDFFSDTPISSGEAKALAVTDKALTVKLSDNLSDGVYVKGIPAEGLMLYEDDDVTVSIVAGYGRENNNYNQVLYAKLENRSSETVSFDFDDIYLNGNLTVEGYYYKSVDAASTEFVSLGEITKAFMLEKSQIKTLDLKLKKNRESQNIHIVIPDTKEKLGYIINPYLGARTQNQPVCDNNGLRITLVGFGDYVEPGYNSTGLDVRILVENTSSDIKIVRFNGLAINGIFLPLSSAYGFYPGEKILLTRHISNSDFEDRGISDIFELSMLVTADPDPYGETEAEKRGERWYSVNLTEHNDAKQNTEKGKLLWKKGDVSVYLVGNVIQKTHYAGGSYLIWKLLIDNQSDYNFVLKTRENTLFDGISAEDFDDKIYNDFYVSAGACGAHTKAYADLSVMFVDEQTPCRKIEFEFRLESMDAKTIYDTSDKYITLSCK